MNRHRHRPSAWQSVTTQRYAHLDNDPLKKDCLMDLAENSPYHRLGQVSSADLERGQRRETRRYGVFDKGVNVVLNCLG
jgi:hypothetical protein